MALPQFLEDLDLAVFSVGSSTSDHDKISLLRLQKLVSTAQPDYVYLEIGSDRGGSLIPHLRDANCTKIISIDLRPNMQPDERGTSFPYPVDGEEQMLKNLTAQLTPAELTKLVTFKSDIRDVATSGLPKVDLALIDGEHTNVACFSDADRVLDFVGDNAILAFHDSNLISDALQNFERMLTRLGTRYTTVLLSDQVAAIGLGRFSDLVDQDLSYLSANRSEYFAASQAARWQAIAWSMRDRGLVADESNEKNIEIAQLKHQLLKMEDLYRAERDLNEDFLKSSSWKITAPLRGFARAFRRLGLG